MLSVVPDDTAQAELRLDMDELFREGARRMLAAALEAEVDAYIAACAALTDEHGHRLVRRNGHAPARTIAAGVGQVEVVRPRVDDRRVDPATGQRMRFQSMILPRWCRRSPKVAAVLPLLYLHGLSSSDFVPALTELLGSAAGLSASVITRLCQQWQAEHEAFAQRDLSEVDYVYCWADGIHFSIRLGEQGSEDPSPRTIDRPVPQPRVDALPRAVLDGQVHPLRFGGQEVSSVSDSIVWSRALASWSSPM